MTSTNLVTYPARPVKGAFNPAHRLPGNWAYEPKLNGWRAMLYLPTGTLYNRHGKPLSIGHEFRWAIGELFARFGDEFTWLDVEALERRHTMLQGWLVLLDVIVPMVSYKERRELFAGLPELDLNPVPSRMKGWVCRLPSYTIDQTDNVWEMMQLVNQANAAPFYEGFVAKRIESEYPIQTRSDSETTQDWVKMRFIYD